MISLIYCDICRKSNKEKLINWDIDKKRKICEDCLANKIKDEYGAD